LFALVDVNNFYASCERLFEPRLEGVAVVVLSNNDGCIIARSQEAKDLGIPMGEPVHKVKDVLRRERVRVYSSNYALYGDLSGRVVSVLKRFTPYLEVYSIDESFLDLGGFADPAAHSHDIKDTVLRWTGLPVSVGVGATKTLAKAANRIAKKDPALGGVFIMPDDPDDVLGNLNTDAIWGIGRRLAARLDRIGITTALDLKNADSKFIRARFSVVVERTVLELRGTPCLALEMTVPAQKGIMVSRGFSRRVTDYRDIEAAVATYASRAAEKLRRQGLSTNKMTISLRTSPFSPAPERYAENWNTIPGCYLTGDVALRDADGYYMVVGRADDVLNVAGHRIGSAEVESALVSHPSVAEAAVIGKPDELRGESIKGFVTLRMGQEPSEEMAAALKAHVRHELGPIAVPSEIEFTPTLPKTRSGKIMRRLLKAQELGLDPGDITTLEE